jgi:hypothetical protein
MAPKEVMPRQNGQIATTAPQSPSLQGHGTASFVRHSQHIVCEQHDAVVCDLRHISWMQYTFLHIEHASSSLGIGILISTTDVRMHIPFYSQNYFRCSTYTYSCPRRPKKKERSKEVHVKSRQTRQVPDCALSHLELQ